MALADPTANETQADAYLTVGMCTAQHLVVANATELAPPVYRGNWMEAVHGHMRWFEDDGKPRQQRPKTWSAPLVTFSQSMTGMRRRHASPSNMGSASASTEKQLQFLLRRNANSPQWRLPSGRWAYADPATVDAGTKQKATKKGGAGGGKRKGSSKDSGKPKGSRLKGTSGGGRRADKEASAQAARRLAAFHNSSSSSSTAGSRKLQAQAHESWWTSTPFLQASAPNCDLQAAHTLGHVMCPSSKQAPASRHNAHDGRVGHRLATDCVLQDRGPAIDVYDDEQSYYLPWIKSDLEPWKNGIEQVCRVQGCLVGSILQLQQYPGGTNNASKASCPLLQADIDRASALAHSKGPYCYGGAHVCAPAACANPCMHAASVRCQRFGRFSSCRCMALC